MFKFTKTQFIILGVTVTTLLSVTTYNLSRNYKEETQRQAYKIINKGKTNNKIIKSKPVKIKNPKKTKAKPTKPVKIRVAEVKNPNKRTILSKQQNKRQYISNYEFETITRTVQAEAIGEPYQAKRLIAEVILNRKKIYKTNAHAIVASRGQFSGFNTRLYHRKLDKECIRAVKEAINNTTNYKVSHFCNKKLCRPAWTKKFRFITRVGDTWFYRNNELYKKRK